MVYKVPSLGSFPWFLPVLESTFSGILCILHSSCSPLKTIFWKRHVYRCSITPLRAEILSSYIYTLSNVIQKLQDFPFMLNRWVNEWMASAWYEVATQQETVLLYSSPVLPKLPSITPYSLLLLRKSIKCQFTGEYIVNFKHYITLS